MRRRTGGDGSGDCSVDCRSGIGWFDRVLARFLIHGSALRRWIQESVIWLPERRLASHPVSSSFIFFSASKSLIRPKTSVNGAALAARLFHFRQQLILVIGFHRLLVDLDRGPQTVFHQLHQLDLVAETLLQRALSQTVTLQRGVPSLVGGAIRMKFADLGNAGSDLFGGSGLRWAHLFAQQFLIDQAIECGLAFGGGERVRIAAIRKASKATSCSQSLCKTTWPLTSVTTRSTI